MSEFCNYAASLDHMLRDRLVCGCKDDSLQKRLLAEEKLTLSKAMSIAQAMEQATKNVSTMRGQQCIDTAEKVQAISILSKKRQSSKTGKQTPRTQTWSTTSRERFNQKRESNKSDKCTRCDNQGHIPVNCPYKESIFHACGKKGHIIRACYNKESRKHEQRTNCIIENEDQSREYEVFKLSAAVVPLALKEKGIYHIPALREEKILPEPYRISCRINDVNINMEVDTGSAVSLISSYGAEAMITKNSTSKSGIQLKSFSGHQIDVVGISQVKVAYRSHEERLPIIIYKGRGPILCGRSWISSSLPILQEGVIPQASSVSHVSSYDESLAAILTNHEPVFDTKQKGCLKNVKVHLHRKSGIKPRFFKARTIPYAYKNKVDEELQRLEETKIISPVPYAQSAAPIVPVMKPNGKIRICGDFKVTEKYPLPKAEDIFAKLAGCKIFTRLDMRDAYSQLELDEESKDLVVINTPKGLFQYNYLPYGISSASAVFQKHMEALLRNQQGVTPFQDDILLGGIDENDHLKILDSLLQVFEDSNLKLRREKCQFAKSSIDFLGHHLDSKGLHPQATKLTAISEAPEPKSLEELRSFLGLLNYYSKFIPNYASHLTPLFRLLEKTSCWKWEREESETFKKAKNLLIQSKFLAHFDPHKEIRLAADASPTGIGVVISHVIDDEERPISFASRTLSPAEKNYSQLEKEALSLVYGVTKFRDYLLGRRFTLITDHQPLVSLLSENKPIPQMSAARLQRWALVLSAYDYQIQHKKGSTHSNADALSRLPLPVKQSEPPLPTEYVLLTEMIDNSPTTTTEIRRATENDLFLTKILTSVINGWTRKDKDLPEARPYYSRRDELSTMRGILMIGQRVVIPEILRPRMLKQLHETHQGIVKMKSLARSMFWWPGIDSDIVEISKQCTTCQSLAPEPPKTFSQWPMATAPWQRVHCDFAGPIENKLLFITVDAFTKWIEVDVVATTSTDTVIRSLRTKMARFGIIRKLITDNATCFTSDKFKEFTSNNGIQHNTIAPYHPQSNGQAERTVRIIKGSLKKLSEENTHAIDILEDGFQNFTAGTLEQRLSRILMRYRRTPLTCGKSPAELMLGRNIVTCLDLCHPRNHSELSETNVKRTVKFQLADLVYMRNYSRGPKWIPGHIHKRIGNVMYEVMSGNRTLRKHQNQLKERYSSSKNTTSKRLIEVSDHKTCDNIWLPTPASLTNRSTSTENGTTASNNNEPASDSIPSRHSKDDHAEKSLTPSIKITEATHPDNQESRRSQRIRKPVDRLGL